MKLVLLMMTLTLASNAVAYEAQVTKGQMAPSLELLLKKASQDTGQEFKSSDFMLIEERELATSKFKMYVQTNSFIPVAKTAVRIWSDLKTGELILAEMHLDEAAQGQGKVLASKYKSAKFSPAAIKSKQLEGAIQKMVEQVVKSHDSDPRIISLKSKDQWVQGDLRREIEVRGRRGVHFISISLLKNKVVEQFYREFPQSEHAHVLEAHVFPIYEEVEGTGERLPYEKRQLKFLDTHVHEGGDDPLAGLGNTRFPENRYHPLLAGTPLGEMYGLWSEVSLRKKVEEVVGQLPLRENSFSHGILLQGKYATINLHPGVKEAFPEINFPLRPSVNHLLGWIQENGAYRAVPISGLIGRPIQSETDLLNRLPERHADHDPVAYINSGFDEVQVYYGVSVLMEALAEMGFTDPELSTKPFHAFLYDPDIAMKDNAYYYDNTINFTTYSPDAPNLARDNPTIWHELGHGLMERLMGVHLGFGDSKGGYGGLSEGMADFIALLVVEQQTEGKSFPGKENFRILNQTGFYLTNEYHDEGESYGGAMSDMLSQVLRKNGRRGLHAFTDLTLEAMRLTRNHPALTAASWFEHMLYADQLGSAVRAPGQFSGIITEALKARNFSFSRSFSPAKMTVTFGGTELTSESPASREQAILACDESGSASYSLKVALSSGDAEFIKFPATVKVEFKRGALQGAIRWVGEENNPLVYTIHAPEEVLDIPLEVSMKCDAINQPDGYCKDYAYLQVFNEGDMKPRAKKRFYLKIKDGATVCSK